MRRKKKKKYVFLNISIIIIAFLMVVSFGYSYLSLVLKIGGEVSGSLNEQDYVLMPGSDPNLNIVVSKTDTWQENGLYKFKYTIKVKNIGSSEIDNFKVTIGFLSKIESISIWNYDYTTSGKTLIITNNIYNLASGQSVNVDFIVATQSSNQAIRTIKLEVTTNSSEVTLEEFNVNFAITSSWGSYTYQYNTTITNKTGTKINAWQLIIILPSGTSFVSGWNAIYNYSNRTLTIRNESYNGKLNNNASTNFGFQLSTNIINFIPSNIKITVR